MWTVETHARCSGWLTFMEFRVCSISRSKRLGVSPRIARVTSNTGTRRSLKWKYNLHFDLERLSSHLNNKRICTIVSSNWPSSLSCWAWRGRLITRLSVALDHSRTAQERNVNRKTFSLLHRTINRNQSWCEIFCFVPRVITSQSAELCLLTRLEMKTKSRERVGRNGDWSFEDTRTSLTLNGWPYKELLMGFPVHVSRTSYSILNIDFQWETWSFGGNAFKIKVCDLKNVWISQPYLSSSLWWTAVTFWFIKVPRVNDQFITRRRKLTHDDLWHFMRWKKCLRLLSGFETRATFSVVSSSGLLRDYFFSNCWVKVHPKSFADDNQLLSLYYLSINSSWNKQRRAAVL